jgi:putative membrane protein
MSVGSSASRWRWVVLAAWAAGLAALLGLGRYTLFIRAGLWPLLLASLGIVLMFMVAMVIRPAERGKLRAATWLRGALLMLPLLYMLPLFFKSAASGLGSYALEKRSLDEDASLNFLPAAAIEQSSPASAGTTANEKVMTLGYLHYHRRELIGQHVLVDGMVSRNETTPAGQMVLYRFVIVCCAADAMPMEMTVTSSQANSLVNDQWVRVGGTVRMETVGTRTIPVLVADQISKIGAPGDPYLSPYHF